MPMLHWESVKQSGNAIGRLRRAQAPGGWLVVHSTLDERTSMVFVPDPKHTWHIEVEEEGHLPDGRAWERR